MSAWRNKTQDGCSRMMVETMRKVFGAGIKSNCNETLRPRSAPCWKIPVQGAIPCRAHQFVRTRFRRIEVDMDAMNQLKTVLNYETKKTKQEIDP